MQMEDEKQIPLTRDERQATNGDVPGSQASGMSKKLHCPQCGSTRIRRRSRYLVISIVVFAGLWAFVQSLPVVMIPVLFGFDKLQSIPWLSSTSMFFSSAFQIFALISIAILVMWPTVICVTAGFALVGRHRCKSCGHRLRPMHPSEKAEAEAHFPWAFCILNGVLLLLLCIVGPIVMRAQSFDGDLHAIMRFLGRGLDDMMAVLSSVLVFLWSLGLSLVCQAIAYRLLKRRIRSRAIWAVLFLLPAITIGGGWFYYSTPIAQARAILARGELASLPKSATDIRVYMWSSPFSGEDFLRFRASPDDIQKFLEESPILRGAKCREYSKDRMRLKYPKDYWQRIMEYREDGNEYFFPDSITPDWYKQEIKGPARCYIINPNRYHYPGEVIVDNEENLVFVYLCFS